MHFLAAHIALVVALATGSPTAVGDVFAPPSHRVAQTTLYTTQPSPTLLSHIHSTGFANPDVVSEFENIGNAVPDNEQFPFCVVSDSPPPATYPNHSGPVNHLEKAIHNARLSFASSIRWIQDLTAQVTTTPLPSIADVIAGAHAAVSGIQHLPQLAIRLVAQHVYAETANVHRSLPQPTCPHQILYLPKRRVLGYTLNVQRIWERNARYTRPESIHAADAALGLQHTLHILLVIIGATTFAYLSVVAVRFLIDLLINFTTLPTLIVLGVEGISDIDALAECVEEPHADRLEDSTIKLSVGCVAPVSLILSEVDGILGDASAKSVEQANANQLEDSGTDTDEDQDQPRFTLASKGKVHDHLTFGDRRRAAAALDTTPYEPNIIKTSARWVERDSWSLLMMSHDKWHRKAAKARLIRLRMTMATSKRLSIIDAWNTRLMGSTPRDPELFGAGEEADRDAVVALAIQAWTKNNEANFLTYEQPGDDEFSDASDDDYLNDLIDCVPMQAARNLPSPKETVEDAEMEAVYALSLQTWADEKNGVHQEHPLDDDEMEDEEGGFCDGDFVDDDDDAAFQWALAESLNSR